MDSDYYSNTAWPRVAVITGAGSGIGAAISHTLGAQGLAVVAADIDGVMAEATANSIKKGGGEALAVCVDVASRSSVIGLIESTVSRYDRLDVLINNAAVISYAPVLELVDEEWDRVLAINLKGAFICAQLAAAVMIKRQIGGVILNVSSISAELPEPDCVHYGVSKAGIAYLTKTLALALSSHRIRVLAISPGTIRTPMNEALLKDPANLESRLATIPMGRLGAAQDIAAAAAFLVSDSASYITGSTLYVEGGMMLVR